MMDYPLDPSQVAAVDMIGRWLNDPKGPQSFTLAGYAGTGKTSIIHKIIEGRDNVTCATPTGKAASVLNGKLEGLGIEVGTLHSMLYKPREITEHDVAHAETERDELKARGLDWKPAAKRAKRLLEILKKGGCEFDINNDPDKPHDFPLVIVDECSMVGDRVEDDLRKVARKILFVGDPGQLPPVEGREFFDREENTPNVVLEEIHRTDADSSILQLAHAVRHGEKFDGWDDNCVIGDAGDLATYMDADVVLTGKNDTRRRLNNLMRRELGFEGRYARKGETVICLRNEWGRGLINGVSGVAASDFEMNAYLELEGDIAYEDRLFKGLPIDNFAFHQYQDPDLDRQIQPTTPETQWDFGHAITVHKSQGSEWDTVLVHDDKMRRHDKKARARWIYTAATRAAKKLIWVSAG